MPHWRALLASCPHTLIDTAGRHVGLPEGQMGNSEVGHMNIGAGRIVYQDLTRIDAAIEDGSSSTNAVLRGACDAASAAAAPCTCWACSRPAACTATSGTSSRWSSWPRRRRRAAGRACTRSSTAATRRRAARRAIARAARRRARGTATRASPRVSGRYYAMDRDKRWDRVRPAYDAIVDGRRRVARRRRAGGAATRPTRAARTTSSSQPTVIARRRAGAMRDGDAVVFMNFRADRARELTARASSTRDFDGFERARVPTLAALRLPDEYDASSRRCRSRSRPSDLHDTLRRDRSPRTGLRQLRIAETEKYAHVTFFFNGGREEPFAGRGPHPGAVAEGRDLRPAAGDELRRRSPTSWSPAIAARQLRRRSSATSPTPTWSATPATSTAAIRAVEAVDAALGRVVDGGRAQVGGAMLDHRRPRQRRA